jgi:excisionase family DNA binding protein
MKELVKAFNVEEIAEYLRLHPYTIRRLAREKKIPAFRAGGQWRFRKDDIDKWSKSYPFSKGKPQGRTKGK